jgi:hypothetical protein
MAFEKPIARDAAEKVFKTGVDICVCGEPDTCCMRVGVASVLWCARGHVYVCPDVTFIQQEWTLVHSFYKEATDEV